MTKYEILDLRSTLGERVTNLSKFWISITFAVFGAAYYAGKDLDLFSALVLIFFYAVSTLMCGMSIRLLEGQVKSLRKDAQTYLQESGPGDQTEIIISLSNVSVMTKSIYSLMTFSFVAYCFYMFRGGI